MSNQNPKWTAEPWECESDRIITASDEHDGGDIICRRPDELNQPMSFNRWSDNSGRIVQCVNACAGIEDPTAEIARLREVEKALKDILEICENRWRALPVDTPEKKRIAHARKVLKGEG